jgi:beta-lactamase regulating signal transducer with metallopeptidase domain
VTKLELIVGMAFVKPAAVLLVATLTTAALRRHSAAARHAVWASALITLLALPLMSAVLPPLRLPLLGGASERPLAEFGAAEGPLFDGELSRAGARDAASRNVDRARFRSATFDVLSHVLLATWLLGALLLGGARIGAEFRVRRIVRRSRPVTHREITRVFHRAALQAGIRTPLELRVSGDVTSPVVAGAFHPAVLLPQEAEAWAEPDLAAIFLHELAHAARRDGVVNLLTDLAAAAYWCNPIVRRAVRRLRAESERACDDRVLHAGTSPDEYAHVLLRVAAAAARTSGIRVSPAIPIVRARELESRLRAILDPRVSRRPLSHRRVAVCAAAIVAITLPTAALIPVRRAQPLPQQLPEPDRSGDSIAAPASERLPLADRTFRVSAEAAAGLRGPDSALVRRLITALDRLPTHDGDLVRERAAWALAQTRDGRLIEPLLDALRSTDWRVQAYAAWALATARDPRAVAPLLPLLAHPVWRLRAMAAYSLRMTGDPRAEATMQRALTDPAWQVRVEAVEYFAQLGGPQLTERLERRLADRHIAVRTAAARALHR